MGMFDTVKIIYEVPWKEVQEAEWQSKDTPAQYLDHYVIRDDGTLWHEAYDERLVEDPSAPMGFWLKRDNTRWEQEEWEGTLDCHEWVKNVDGIGGTSYVITFWFRDGVVKDAIFVKTES